MRPAIEGRSFKAAFDDAKGVESSNLRKQVDDLETAKKVEPWEQEQRRLVADKMAQFTEEDQSVIQYALQHTSIPYMSTVSQFGDNGPSVMSRAVHTGLFYSHNDHYFVNNAFLLALSHYFHGEEE